MELHSISITASKTGRHRGVTVFGSLIMALQQILEYHYCDVLLRSLTSIFSLKIQFPMRRHVYIIMSLALWTLILLGCTTAEDRDFSHARSIADYQQFLAKYPDGFHSGYARGELQRLEKLEQEKFLKEFEDQKKLESLMTSNDIDNVVDLFDIAERNYSKPFSEIAYQEALRRLIAGGTPISGNQLQDFIFKCSHPLYGYQKNYFALNTISTLRISDINSKTLSMVVKFENIHAEMYGLPKVRTIVYKLGDQAWTWIGSGLSFDLYFIPGLSRN